MNLAFGVRHKSAAVEQRYRAGMRRYLKQGLAASVQPALRLGRQAAALGLETLDLALIHEQALLTEVQMAATSAARDRIIKRARNFFAAAIVPMEETHRSVLESNVKLSRLNRALTRQRRDLAVSNRKLKKEIAKLKIAEQTLRKSEQQSIRLLDQSRRLQEQLRLLSRRILLTQEQERKRISRELHDVIAQILTSINVRLANLRAEASVNTKGLARSILRTQKLVEKSVDVVHQFAYDLRPALLDYLGLIPALHSFMKRFTKETGIRVSLTAFAGANKLDSARSTALYRVAQEALTNVARHAHASQVEATIQRLPRAVCMSIKDNGKSFDVKRSFLVGKGRGMGLLGMRERVEMVGGKFMVESAPGKGTTIQARIPFRGGV
jgi:signal transduction histidine kinase